MKYLAQVELKKRLAPLPESIVLIKVAISGVIGTEVCDLSRLRGEPIHQRFANWRSGPEDIVEFTRRYGPLDWDGELVSENSVTRAKFVFADFEWRERQKTIRELWNSAEEHHNFVWATLSFSGQFPVAEDRDRLSRKYSPPTYTEEEDEMIYQGAETTWEPTRKGPIAYIDANTTWQYLCLLMTFEKRQNLRKCENPDCAAPYFIARRKDQMFCGEDCAHLIAARRWWARSGNQWRRARAGRKLKT